MITSLLAVIALELLIVIVVTARHEWRLRMIVNRLNMVPVANEFPLKEVVRQENMATRSHVSNCVDSVSRDVEVMKLRLADFIEDAHGKDFSTTTREGK